MRRGLLSCPENTSRLYELLMSHLLIKYSIFVLYGREILAVIRVPRQRNAAVYQSRTGGAKITAPTKMLISVNFIVRTTGRRNTRHGHTLFWQKVEPSNFIARFAKLRIERGPPLPFVGHRKSLVPRVTRVKINLIDFVSSHREIIEFKADLGPFYVCLSPKFGPAFEFRLRFDFTRDFLS